MTKKEQIVRLLQTVEQPLSLADIRYFIELRHQPIPRDSVRRIVNELEDDPFSNMNITTTYVRGVKFVSNETGFPKTFAERNGNWKPRAFAPRLTYRFM